MGHCGRWAREFGSGLFHRRLLRILATTAVEAIVQASQELDACRDVGAYARRSMRRLTQCAKNRIKVVESQLPGPLPAKPQIADAEAAFASAGLKTPDAVEDCLVCWDFMTTFRTARGVC